jgi:2-polyprenyl-3-methyl-5-hydroxy-6-metoxy-1,4-benzoquinol methylase
MGDRLASMGYKNITCIDFSKELIKNRQKTNKSCVKYLCHNMLDRFEFEDKFDLIIEKNSLDCLFCFADYPKKLLICMS